MVNKFEQQKVRELISETVLLLCKSSLQFASELSIEALIGITVDHEDVFLVNIKEAIQVNQEDNRISMEHNSENYNKVLMESCTKNTKSFPSIIQMSEFSSKSDGLKNDGITRESSTKNTPKSSGSMKNIVGETKELFSKSSVAYSGDAYSTDIHAFGPAKKHHITVDSAEDKKPNSLFTENLKDEIISMELVTLDEHCYQNLPIKKEFIEEDFSEDLVLESSVENYSDVQCRSTMFDCWSSNKSRRSLSRKIPHKSNNSIYRNQEFKFSWSDVELLPTTDNQTSVGEGSSRSRPTETDAILVRMCPICGEGFGSWNGFLRHIRTHQPGIPGLYLCPFCRKSFTGSTNLRGHLATHTNVREFKCHLCEKDYAYKKDLSEHLMGKHNIISSCGLTENAGLENEGQLKSWGWKMHDKSHD